MKVLIAGSAVILIAFCAWLLVNKNTSSKQASTPELEQRLVEIDTKLTKLAAFTMRNGVGRIGYRSVVFSDPNHEDWVQIRWDKPREIDQIVLVPVIWRDTKLGLVADGFPTVFKVRIGTDNDPEGTVIASYTEADKLLPRVAPLIIKTPPTQASWVKIEASKLTSSVWNKTWFRLKFSEILVFSGNENIAIQQPVEVGHPLDSYQTTTGPDNLVDGFMPYEMDSVTGERSLAFIGETTDLEKPQKIVFNLGSSLPINSVHLHRVDMNDSIPQSVEFDYAIPEQLIIEGANREDFSDAVLLDKFNKTSIYEVGPIMKRRFSTQNCQFIRLTAINPQIRIEDEKQIGYVGFSEIELFSNGKNVARKSKAETTFEPHQNINRRLDALNDGRNFYGDILDDRTWLDQLALRHELETERPELIKKLNVLYANQKMTLDRLRWLTAILATGIVITVLIDRLIRQRQMVQMKQRLAADLHDELGANLHTIGLLSDLAEDTKSTKELSKLHRQIRSETERSGNAVRRCTNMLRAKGVYSGLEEDIPRVARRILGDLEHDFSITGTEHLDQLDPRTGYDLFLFYKECLVNISRHSEATEFKTEVDCTENEITISVSDNGKGISTGESIPPSLKRRAKLLKAKIRAIDEGRSGTSISLTTKIK